MPCAVLLLTHGAQGEDLLATAAHMLGEHPPRAAAINLLGNERRGDIERRVREVAEELLNDADGLLLLSDLFGSTQALIAEKISAAEGKIACVHGVNLAMLLEALDMRHLPPAELGKQAAAAAKKAIAAAR